jgi:HSP20 family molecular chaperone IbpA
MRMFSKKTCQRCGRKTNKDSSFCPSCGNSLKKAQSKEEFGMLGENDSLNEFESLSNSMFGGMGGSFMNKMLANTMRMLEKELEREMKNSRTNLQNQNSNINNNSNMNGQPRTKIRLMINGKEIDINNMNGKISQNPQKKEKQRTASPKFKRFSEEQAKKFSKLPKKEPKTELKRIADKISYEIEVPGVESIEDISINTLENSIEIKAIANEKAYSKSIPLNLPIVDYAFSKGLLVLEFKGN